MNPLRIFFAVGLMIGFFWMVSSFFASRVVPDQTDPAIEEMDLARPRAPDEARSLKNPIPLSNAVIERGNQRYHGAGGCSICHGLEGRGDGQGGVMLTPRPRDLTNHTFQTLRTDGEIFWSIKNGVPQTGMFSYVPRMVTEEQAWEIVHYIRTLR